MSFLSRISDKLFGNTGKMKDFQVAAEKRKADKDKREAQRKKDKPSAKSPPM